MFYRFLYLIACVVLIASCNGGYRQTNPYGLTITNSFAFDSLPSASAIAVFQDSVYIIGDDAPWVYKMNKMQNDEREIEWIKIPGADSSKFRIPKDVKNDFEASAIGTVNDDVYHLAFGSGSLSPYRDSLLFFNVKDEWGMKKVSLAVFYDSLLTRNKMEKKDFNIEGATIAGNFLYLFNRADGLIFQINWQEFYNYINNTTAAVPSSTTHRIELPRDGEVQAGFSGACTLDKNTIIFTASLEDTKDWVQDGEIKGSYIGVLDIVNPKVINLYAGMRVQNDSSIYREARDVSTIKLESVDVLSNSRENIELIAVADNDNGTSTIFHIRLDKK